MRCWILFTTVISLSLVGVRANEREHASLATSVSDENDANNFMEEAAADANDYLTDIQFDEDPRFNLTIPRSAIIAARRFTVPIPLMLDGRGINTSFRHCYCFKRLVRFVRNVRNGFIRWRVRNLVGYVVSGNTLYVFYRCDRLRI